MLYAACAPAPNSAATRSISGKHMFLINFSKSVAQLSAHVFDVAFRWADIVFGVNECSECSMHVLARNVFASFFSQSTDSFNNMYFGFVYKYENRHKYSVQGTPRVCGCVLL